ncbi:hypothetical protein KVR01_004354 [Diaporthe batatas]|uniref:uncharacterized protein n=1 Tax=Diaporthe batatas TaxID=748121 RepID=UPI001D046FDB|nr:uncharacterized protein KVR01_004354 [Diaporthe batatas]KAG8165802.1 hypothetical protein KVR01_004354 [Diaporthe batatas]
MLATAQIHQTQAIVCRPPQDGARTWVLEDVALSAPAEDEVIVEMVATGICHSDIRCGSGTDGEALLGLPPYPRVLGHEGAGVVKSVGSKVTKVKDGDRVLLSMSFCEECHCCKAGGPGFCKKWGQINMGGVKDAFSSLQNPGEAVGGSFFGQSSFSRLTRVKQCSVVRVTGLVDNDEELKLLAPLGCGIQTGAGTMTKLADAQPEDTVAVLGLGAVGLSGIMAAKIRGCRMIIAVDRVPSRLELAKSVGATHTINTSTIKGTLTEEVRGITGGVGTTITMDASAAAPLIRQALEFTANQGKTFLLTTPPKDPVLQLDLSSLIFYIPTMIQWYKDGEFPVEKLVKFYPAQDHLQAVKDMEDGTTVKPILLW